MKKAPLFILFILSILIFSLFGFLGKDNIYSAQDQKPLEKPFLTSVFTGINDEIYPWDLFDSEKRKQAKEEALERQRMEEEMLAKKIAENKTTESTETEGMMLASNRIIEGAEKVAAFAQEKIIQAEEDELPSEEVIEEEIVEEDIIEEPEEEDPFKDYVPRYEPLSETAYDEYVNHISADIYGDMGVQFASSYPFVKVTMEYFDDALFIGDSRTVGLIKYTDISEHADSLCETSLTIWKTFKSNFKGKGTVESFLKKKQYKKIYIMVGVNELGTGKTEDYMKEFTSVIDKISEMQPEAIIYIQAIMNVDREKSTHDGIFNNDNIRARNHAIATLADNKTIFYIDENEALCDEDGFLRDDLRGDHLHLKGASNELWKEFLLSHAVILEGTVLADEEPENELIDNNTDSDKSEEQLKTNDKSETINATNASENAGNGEIIGNTSDNAGNGEIIGNTSDNAGDGEIIDNTSENP